MMLLVYVYNAYIRLNIQELKHLSFHYDKNFLIFLGLWNEIIEHLSSLISL